MLVALAAIPALPFSARADALQPVGSPPGRGSALDDMAIFRAAMGIHPGLYRYAGRRDVAARLDRLEAAYIAGADAESFEDCYLALSRFLTTIRCGHSYANFFNQNDSGVTALFDRPTRLPLHFEWIGNEMIVLADHSGNGRLARGTRVTHIGDMAVGDLLTRLIPYTRGDGGNDGKRRSLLGVRGDATYETFDIFQGMLLPPGGGEHRLRIVTPDGAEQAMTLPAINLSARRAAMTREAEDSDQPRWQWTMRSDGVAVLTMNGWAMWNSQWDWRGWLEERLDSLAGAKGLIIDIRANEGGDDCGDPILARLTRTDLDGWDVDVRLRFTEVPRLLTPHISTWDDSFRTLGAGAAPLGDGYYARPGEARPPPVRPSAKQLDLPVAALIGPVNSSATFGFINAARASGKVRLFGDTTGGNRRGINGGAFFFTKLPYSAIVFDLPLIGYFARTPQPDAGIAPDVFACAGWRDVAARRDVAMDAATQWIARG